MLAIMSHYITKSCRTCSLLLFTLLIFQASFSQNRFTTVDQWMDAHLRELGGRATLVIMKNGKIIYNHSENNLSPAQRMMIKFFARRQGQDPQQALHDFNYTTREPIASSSKWLTAALVMTFVDDGTLKLHDTIGKYLPVFSKYGKGNITILDCLSHETGINGGDLKQSREIITNSPSMKETMQKIAALPMEGSPGKTFHYSSIGPQIAAGVIENISGKDFRTLFRNRIAIPCEMINTDFGSTPVPLAAGGAYSTPKDYIHFLQMILQDGRFNGKQVLSETSIKKMETNYASGSRVVYSPVQAGDWGYGLGLWIMDNHMPQASTVSSPGLFGTFPWIDNPRKYAGFLFVLNLNTKDREENYKDLKSTIDGAIDAYPKSQ
jgi:CubicO group peptidase (beta-lactamase class C family)